MSRAQRVAEEDAQTSVATTGTLLSPRADVMELSSPTAVAAAPMSQVQLLAMLPEGATRTAAVLQALAHLARADEVAREREQQRLDLVHQNKMHAFDLEHQHRMAVIDEKRESIRAERKRKEVAFAQMCEERNYDLKRHKLDDECGR
jgi:hypothetical protein